MSTVLAKAYKNSVMASGYKGMPMVRRFRYHIASTGSALSNGDIIKLVKFPKEAVILNVEAKWEAGGGTNTFGFRLNDGSNTTTLKTGLTGGSNGYFRLIDETAAAGTMMVPAPAATPIDFDLEILLAGANGWPVDKYIEGMVTYYTPSFDDEITDSDD